MPTTTQSADIFRDGDLIGVSGYHWHSHLINLATYGVPFYSISHIGICCNSMIYESCYPQGTHCKPLESIYDYNGKAWHYRLYRPLYAHEQQRLSDFLNSTLNLPYDQIGAFRAGGLGFSWLESKLRPPNLASIYCSEWCCAALTLTGIFQTDHVSRWSPNRLVRTLRRRELVLPPHRLK